MASKRKRKRSAGSGDDEPGPDPTLAPGAGARNGEMVIRYTSGQAREGERATQLRLRRRLMDWAARALAHWCAVHSTTWLALPLGRADIDVLNTPPEAVAPRAPDPQPTTT